MEIGSPTLSLIDQMYETAIHPANWTETLRGIADVFQASCATLIMQDIRRRTIHASSIGFDEQAMAAYAKHYVHINPWWDAAARSPDPVVVASNIIDLQDLEETEFYRDFLRPFDAYYGAGLTAARRGEYGTTLSLLRSKRVADFAMHDIARLRVLQPHLDRALQISRRLAGAETQSDAGLRALHELSVSLAVTDETGRILFASKEAEQLLARGGCAS